MERCSHQFGSINSIYLNEELSLCHLCNLVAIFGSLTKISLKAEVTKTTHVKRYIIFIKIRLVIKNDRNSSIPSWVSDSVEQKESWTRTCVQPWKLGRLQISHKSKKEGTRSFFSKKKRERKKIKHFQIFNHHVHTFDLF